MAMVPKRRKKQSKEEQEMNPFDMDPPAGQGRLCLNKNGFSVTAAEGPRQAVPCQNLMLSLCLITLIGFL